LYIKNKTMSQTIITKNNIDFYTNISEEHLIGRLCKLVGAKHYSMIYSNLDEYISLAHYMTNEEALDAAMKLQFLIDTVNLDDLFSNYKHYFNINTTTEDFKCYIEDIIEIFKTCGGYECLS